MKGLVRQMVSILVKVDPKMRMINGWTRCSKKQSGKTIVLVDNPVRFILGPSVLPCKNCDGCGNGLCHWCCLPVEGANTGCRVGHPNPIKGFNPEIVKKGAAVRRAMFRCKR